MSPEFDTGSRATLTVTPGDLSRLRGLPESADHRLYVLVFHGESSAMMPLPRDGAALVGRDEDADIRLRGPGVSRHHARIDVVGGAATLVDLDSQNGTTVNGERITDARRLLSGDVVGIHSATLVVYSSESPRHDALVDMDAFRHQVEAEIDRAVGYGRSVAVFALSTDGAPDRSALMLALKDVLRRMDRLTWNTAGQGFLLFPETDADAAAQLASRVVEIVAPKVAGARVGYALCPRDGCHASTLLAAARNALATARTGEVATAEQAYRVIDVGERAVLVADEAMSRVFGLLGRLAEADLPVLITGETGTGKDLAAAAIHELSPRRARPFVALNCAALQDTLVESELFGYDKGAFSGATAAKPGLLETADGGTVFFDEVASLSPASQAKLLRVLETKRFTRLGDVRERTTDMRVVAAASQDLREAVAEGRFRDDLYFRLGAATVWLPPLRDRKTEIPLLAGRFLSEACARTHGRAMTLTEDALLALSAHAWPGNVRQLKNIVEFLAVAVAGPMIDAWHVEEQLDASSASGTRRAAPSDAPPIPDAVAFRPIKEELQELERTRMTEALAAAAGNQTRAAALIQMPLRTFVARLKLYGIRG